MKMTKRFAIAFALLAAAAMAQSCTVTTAGGDCTANGFKVFVMGPGSPCHAFPQLPCGDPVDEWVMVEVTASGSLETEVVMRTAESTQSSPVTGTGTVAFLVAAGDSFQSVTVTEKQTSSAPKTKRVKSGRRAN